jgi:hypothetical protein
VPAKNDGTWKFPEATMLDGKIVEGMEHVTDEQYGS